MYILQQKQLNVVQRPACADFFTRGYFCLVEYNPYFLECERRGEVVKSIPLVQLLHFFHTTLITAAIHHPHHEANNRLFCSFLKELFRAKRRRKITRTAIREYRYSPFYYLLLSVCRQSMITATGFDYRSFHSLLQLFSPFFITQALTLLEKSVICSIPAVLGRLLQ